MELGRFTETLKRFILLGQNSNSKISLSLSGGLDSRVILSFLIASNHSNWDAHTFESDSKADYVIAKKLADDLNFSHKTIQQAQGNENLLPNLNEYIGSTYLTESGYVSRKLNSYKLLNPNDIVIDGGFGEIWRRSFLTRQYYFGMKYIRSNEYDKIVDFLRLPRADLFVDEVNQVMQRGILHQLEELIKKLPLVEEIGKSNWLDFFSLKTRLVNYYAPEQGRIDNFIRSHMPFVQLDLVNYLYSVPATERMKDKLFKGYLSENSRKLTKYPIGKGDSYYPFWFTPLQRRVYAKVISKSKKEPKINPMDKHLMDLKEFALDSVSSLSVKNYSQYNYDLVNNNVSAYYQGKTENRTFVDWFISFEIFRQMVERK